MTPEQYYSYLASLAEKHVQIQHSESSKHYFRGELEEFYMDLRNKVRFPALIAESYDLSYTDDGEKTRETSFIVATNYSESKNWNQIYAATNLCENIGEDILRRMLADEEGGEICAAISLVSATPLLNEMYLYAGVRFTISVNSVFDDAVDAEKWTDLQ